MEKIGFIYKMSMEGDDKQYIGSTFGDINKRFKVHKNNIKNRRNKMYEYFNDKIAGDYNLMKCELIEEVVCHNRYDLHNKEFQNIQQFIRDNGKDNCLNTKFKSTKPITIGGVKMVQNVRDYNRGYYHQKNKHKILTKKHCPACDIDISGVNWGKHAKTKKHIKMMNEYNNLDIVIDDDGYDGNEDYENDE